MGPTVLQRVVDHADGWLPIGGRGAALADRIVELHRLCGAAGRDPIPVTIYQPGPRADTAHASATTRSHTAGGRS